MDGWYAIVDGAADPRLYPIVSESAQHACLYENDYPPDTREAMPYLVALKDGEQLPDIWRKHEAGRFWGIVFQSTLDFAAIRRHLRKFTTARLPEGDVVLFRFWDPRIFVIFAEQGKPEEVEPFFEKIDVVIADLGPEGRRRYNWANGLQTAHAQPVAAAADQAGEA